MSEMKHTPGPWKLCYDGQLDGADGSRVLGFDWDSYKEFNDRSDREKANDRLIAARPELLEALRDLLAEASGGTKSCGHDFTCVCAFDKARAAVRKATGGAQ